MISPELLRKYPFFNFMNDAQLKAVAMIGEQVEFGGGQVIIPAATPATALYLVVDGVAAYYYVVTTEHDPYYKQEHYISDFVPGEPFGISALIEPYIYTAEVRAEKSCTVVKIDASALRALCEVDAKLSCGLMQAVAKAAMERLQDTRAQLVAAHSN